MLTAFGPNPATLFLSWRGGARASAPPRQDDFREVFQSRVLGRLTSRDRMAPAANSIGGPGKSRLTSRPQAKPLDSWFQAVSGSDNLRRMAGARETNRRDETRQARKQGEFQATVPGVAADVGQRAEDLRPGQAGANIAGPPQPLQDLIAFLQSLPNGSLKVAPEQIPAVANYLLSAGLPREEVEGLLWSPDFAEKGLNAADLQAAWQRTQGQAASAETAAQFSAEPGAAVQPGLNLPPKAQEMVQASDYRAKWGRATVPESALPALRLALARLGCSPQDLVRLEEEAQGQGLSLSRVWQTIQQAGNRVSQPEVRGQNRPFDGGNPSPSAMLGERQITAAEVAEWRQLLVKAGLEPEVVDKMLGQAHPATQGDLKTTLLALAPPEEPVALSDPKPLYLPENLRLRPFFPKGQANGDQTHLHSQGNGEQQFGFAARWAANPGEAFPLPALTGELPMFNPNLSGAGALSSTGPRWNPVAPEVRESLWSQLQSGIISNLQPGENQVSLRLNPPEMGQIQLTLNLSGQELAVTAVASRPEIAELAAQGVQQLLQALAQQGLVLTQFQVRLQDQPQGLTALAQAGGKEKSGESGESGAKFSASTRRRSGEVDRFV